MGKMQLLWLCHLLEESLQAAHLRIFLIEAKTAITSEVLIFFFIIRKLLASG